jgi:transposase
MPPQISIPLDLPDVRVLQTEMDPTGDYIITVESTLESTKCRKCGREITQFHGHDDGIRLRHLPILGRRVYVQLRPKRYQCPYCEDQPTSTQTLSWYDAKSPHTKAYDQYLLLGLVHSTITDICIKETIGYKAVVGAVNRHIGRTVDWGMFTRIEVLGLDEIALKKGHDDFVVIVTAQDRAGQLHLLAVLPDRTKERVKEFLRSIPEGLQRTIEQVCTDMYDGYINAVKEVLGSAVVVVDRFHVAKKYREGADALRKQEVKRLKKELSAADYARIKGHLWAFRKNQADVQPHEAEVLEELFRFSPVLKQAYDFREELTKIFNKKLSKVKATKKIKAWQERVRASGLTCFDSFLTTLDNWMDEITNYFLHRQNSGFVEGLNNKLKVLKRRCYGIFNVGHLFQRIFLDLEGYRLFARASV